MTWTRCLSATREMWQSAAPPCSPQENPVSLHLTSANHNRSLPQSKTGQIHPYPPISPVLKDQDKMTNMNTKKVSCLYTAGANLPI